MNSKTLAKHPFLAGMDDAQVETLLKGSIEQEFAAGEIIFREGEPANRFYLIESGEVALEFKSASGKTGDFPIQTLAAGDAMGWSWLFPPFAWHFSARAIRPTRVISCDGGHLLVTAEEDPAFGYALMKRVSQIVIERLQRCRKSMCR